MPHSPLLRPSPALSVALAALATCVCTFRLAAQEPALRIRSLNVSHGLSSAVTTALYRDHSGMVWIGTPAGLNRYDGYEVEHLVHDPGDPGSLPGNHVRVVYEDRLGTLWVGTAGGGLSRLERGTQRFERLELPSGVDAGNDWVETLEEDREGRLWVGTLGGGLMVLDPDAAEPRRYGPDDGTPGALSHNLVNVVFEDSSGRIWAGTDRGLNLWDSGTDRFTSFLSDPADPTTLPSDRVLAIQEDSTGVVWVGTETGLARIDPEPGKFTRVPHDGRPGGLSHPHVTSLVAGAPGTLWVGTFGGGLNELDTERVAVRTVRGAGAESELGDARLRRMVPGAEGAVWIGSWGGGVSRASRSLLAFDLIAHDENDPGSLPRGDAADVAVDAEGGLWVATAFAGVHWRPRGRSHFVHFRHEPDKSSSLSGDDAKRLLVSSTGHVWVGTLQSGLNRLDPATGRVDRYPPTPGRAGGLASNRTTALLEDDSGTLWVGTSNGLYRLDDPDPPGTFTSVAGLESDYVEALLQATSGDVWIGTAGGGLVRLTPASLTHERFRADPEHPSSLRHDHVTAIQQSPSGTLWVGTLGGGVARVEWDGDTPRFHPYLKADGLISNSIAAILWDDTPRLWLTTREGLSILTRRGGDVLNFDMANGLPVGEFTTGAAASSDQLHYFGTPAGVVVAPRRPVLPAPALFPVVVTSARALGSDLALPLHRTEDVAEVPFGDVLHFRFAVLDYETHDAAAYAYRLEGLDEGWVELGSTREIAFSNLDPGEYALFVRGSARRGPWTEASAPIRFVIVPPFWLTGWFRTVVALGVLGMAVGMVLVRVRAMEVRERAIREKEDQFGALLENAHDLVSILDPEGRVHYVGPSVERILGYEVNARMGRRTTEIVHPGDHEALKDWLEQVFEGGSGVGTPTLRVRAADGSWRLVEPVGSAFELPDGQRRAIVNARDVTERTRAEARSRELEQALYQRQRLEAIGTLAGGVAHEFNNLLTVIGGHATLLEEDADDEAATRESAAAIRRAQQSGAALTRQLLAFARKQVVSQGAVNVNEQLESLERLFQRLLGEQVSLDLVLAADRPWVEGDEDQLEQVLMNLVVNARDAMPSGGRLEIRTANLRVNEHSARSDDLAPGDWLVLRVTDDGTGIDPDALPHVFEPFYTTKQRGKGTGLGLSTVYGIVTHGGGHLTVESEPGVGTSFRVFLKGADAPTSPRVSHETAEQPLPMGTGTILVAEDDGEILALVGSVLRRQGFSILEAKDGLGALRILEAAVEPPRLLLTDLIMPRLNGAELARRARALWADMPVVFMTGYDDGTIARAELDLGADILHKPFTPRRLASRVHQALAGASRERPSSAPGWE